MKQFKSVILVKHPKTVVWKSIRDHLLQLTPYLDDVASITEESRLCLPQGTVQITNRWQADTTLPTVLQPFIDSQQLGWTDHAQWFEDRSLCIWRIEPHFLSNAIQCHGETRYEPAMGGRGARITFEGEIHLETPGFPGMPSFMEATAAKTLETLITTLIPQNFRKVTTALSHLLKTPQATELTT